MEPIYSAAKGVFYPWLRFGLGWTVEGEHLVPRSGPAILASNHVSYLDPLVLAFLADRRGRRTRFLAKQELFDKRGLGPLLRAMHQIPVQRGTSDARHALDAAVRSVQSGECVAVFPEGTISLSLDPMPGKSGTARLAQASQVAVLPVGLWGAHRILTKHRKPNWQWGVPQVVVVGDAIWVGRDEPASFATGRIMTGIRRCVARARELYPAAPEDHDEWWWRSPESALEPPHLASGAGADDAARRAG